MKNPLLKRQKMAGEMDRGTVVEALKAVNNVLSRKGQKAETIVVGGAAIMFLFDDFPRPVKDLDGCGMSSELLSAVEEVAWEKDLTDGWFNATSNMYLSSKDVVQGPKFSNLSVMCPHPNLLLCMKLRSGRTEERGNDAKDVEFLVSKMPDIHTEQDWQALYKHYFGAADWKPWLAERANIAVSHKVAKQGSAPKQPEPLMTCLINQMEWKNNEDIKIFSDPIDVEGPVDTKGKQFMWPPKRDKTAHATSDETGRFWGDEGAGVVFYCPKTQKVLVAKRSAEVNEPHAYGTWGGAIDDGESPKSAAQREAYEEAGADVPLGHIDLVFTYKDPHSDFQYHNYAVIVESEFKPHLDWETEDFLWAPLTSAPSPPHFGLKALWPHLKAWVDKQKVASFHQRTANSDLIERAAIFAQEKHASQMRQWSGLPYFSHLEGVANIVRSVGGTPEMVAAAYLHDVIEDQGAPEQGIKENFGPEVAKLVVEMTKVSDIKWPKDKPEEWPLDEKGNPAYPKRRERSEHDRTHYIGISPDGQTIKLADILHNGYDMIDSNPRFTKKTWLPEAELLYNGLTAGNSTLRTKVGQMIAFGKQKLGMV